MALLEWSPSLELDLELMDETHREFAALVNQLGDAPDAEVPACFDALIEHTVAHFEQENVWMQESGFPPIDCHIGEHERVLQGLHSVRHLLAAGDVAIARRAAEELTPWFANHAATMDNALAFHIKRSGYTPVAIKAAVTA